MNALFRSKEFLRLNRTRNPKYFYPKFPDHALFVKDSGIVNCDTLNSGSSILAKKLINVINQEFTVQSTLIQHSGSFSMFLSATQPSQQPNVDPAVVRSLHLDATRYMVLSIPANLTSQEMALVRATIPKEMIRTDELMKMQISEPAPMKVRSNALRLGVANITGFLMAMLFFLIPLLVTCVNWILLYERQHQLSERALAYSIKLGKELGERGSEIPSAYQKFRGGPFGSALVTGGSWLAQGIAGGIVDGVQTAQNYHFQEQISNKQVLTIR
ncbi:hypothetical protein DV737_g4452, partial [Chaetothyriales sp. CBS 132003]